MRDIGNVDIASSSVKMEIYAEILSMPYRCGQYICISIFDTTTKTNMSIKTKDSTIYDFFTAEGVTPGTNLVIECAHINDTCWLDYSSGIYRPLEGIDFED